jgi:hypothetical protein
MGVAYMGLGAPSGNLLFTSATDEQRFVVVLDPNSPRSCHLARMQLRNDALVPAGFLEIRTTTGQEVEIANCDAGGSVLAQVLLTGDGDIRLRPAAGRSIILEGTLVADRICYTPDPGATAPFGKVFI